MGERWILAIDLGNGGPKLAVVTLGGEVLATAHRPVSVHIGLDGTATQDAVEWCYGHFDEREESTQSVAERDAERFAAMFQSRDTQKGSGNVCH